MGDFSTNGMAIYEIGSWGLSERTEEDAGKKARISGK